MSAASERIKRWALPWLTVPTWWARVTPATLRLDALAGLLGALLVLPQALAFAALAGLPPQYGLQAAVLPCIVASLVGSSWHVVTGPTNALSLALLAMLTPLAAVGSPEYIGLALAVTLGVGLMQLTIGTLRLGALAHFISPTALLGFTTGAALLIMLHSLRDALGLPASASPDAARTHELVLAVIEQAPYIQPGAVIVTLVTLLAALLAKRWWPRWPHLLIGLAVGSLTALALDGALLLVGAQHAAWWHVARWDALPVFHASWTWPALPLNQLPEWLGISAALTVVALAQSIAIAKALAERSGQHIDPNREFVGQGLANVVASGVGGYVVCGSMNRSVPNYEAGARTPLAAVASALLLLPLALFGAPLLAWVPLAGIAGILLLVGWALLNLDGWRLLTRASTLELGVAATTCVATLTLRLEAAVVVGSALSLGIYLQRTSRPPLLAMGFDRMTLPRRLVVRAESSHPLPECPQIKIVRMAGSVYFGATEHVSDQLQTLRDESPQQRHLLLMASSMNFVDVAGSALWRNELRHRRRDGGDFYVHRPRPEVLAHWRRDGFLTALGENHLFTDKREAFVHIIGRLDPERCATCSSRVFSECGPPGTRPQDTLAHSPTSAD